MVIVTHVLAGILVCCLIVIVVVPVLLFWQMRKLREEMAADIAWLEREGLG